VVTGRCVIVHEAARTGGFGAEIAALIAERGLLSLLAPVIRVTGYDTVIPLPRLERHYMPSVARVVAAVRKTCKFRGLRKPTSRSGSCKSHVEPKIQPIRLP
jgi:2-oxoisovalerate dehydrogenase E1 component subunit beta